MKWYQHNAIVPARHLRAEQCPYECLRDLMESEAEFIIQFVATGDMEAASNIAGLSRATGYRLFKKPYIQAHFQLFIQELQRAKFGKIATAEEVLAGYTRDLRFDPRKLSDEDGGLKKLHDVDEDTALSLCGYKLTKDGVEYKFPDKKSTRDSLARHLGLFAPERVEVNAGENLMAMVAKALNTSKPDGSDGNK